MRSNSQILLFVSFAYVFFPFSQFSKNIEKHSIENDRETRTVVLDFRIQHRRTRLDDSIFEFHNDTERATEQRAQIDRRNL